MKLPLDKELSRLITIYEHVSCFNAARLVHSRSHMFVLFVALRLAVSDVEQ